MRARVALACALAFGATPAHGWFETAEVGSRALGLGNAFVAVADDASAVYWNPAGLSQLRRHELLLSLDRTPDLVDLESGFAALAWQISPLALGLGWQRTALAGAASENLWSVSGAFAPVRRSLGAFIAAGATLKVARVAIETGGLGAVQGLAASQTTVAVDLALLAAPIPNVQVGAVWRNIGEPTLDLQEGGGDTPLEQEFEWGASLRWRRDGWLHLARVRHPGEAGETRVGAEMRLGPALGVRAGIAREVVTGGVDFRVGRWTFDTAYRAHEALGPLYRVGLRLGFGRDRGLGGQYDEF